MKGIKIFGNEIKLSQFVNNTTLFNADFGSSEKALKIVEDFGKLAGLSLNMKRTKAIWLGKWMNSKNKPLNISWFHCPVKVLGIHFSHNKKGNNKLNFSQKIWKLQTTGYTGYVEFKRPDNIRKSNDTKNLGPITISVFGFKPCSSSGNGGFSENKIV